MQLRKFLWGILVDLYPCYLRWRYGMDIGKNCRISWKAHLDKSINPKGIHIGDNTWVLSGAMILAHDHCRSLKADTYIGKNCVIGVRSIIMPGLSIGNQVVIGGSVVTKSIHSNCIAAGNPAKILKENVNVQNGKILMRLCCVVENMKIHYVFCVTL